MTPLLATEAGWQAGAAFVASLALLIHALRAALPQITASIVRLVDSFSTALAARAEARARVDAAHALTESDLRARLDACDAHRDAYAIELAEMQTRLVALHVEMTDLRRAFAAGGH